MASWFQRISPGDLTELATDVGPVPMNVGAALLLDPVSEADLDRLIATVSARLAAIPRLRQLLVDLPLWLGRPVWVDDPRFELATHVERARCAPPGDIRRLLDAATSAVVRPFDRSRPLWRIVVVTDLAGGRAGLVIVFHHVLADGIGGLAVLEQLVDGGATPARPAALEPRRSTDLLELPRPGPTHGELFADAVATRIRSLPRVRSGLAGLRMAGAELGSGRPSLAPRCSLNSATGPHRRVDVLEADLARVREVARTNGATVNDVMLVVTTAALATLLRHRGEDVPELVVSVPIAARAAATTADLGNRTGVMPVRVPTSGPATGRLTHTARLTRAQRTEARGASQALVGPAFRLAAAVGLFRPMINRQRLVNTFLTNLQGPRQPLSISGVGIRRIIPLTITAGNVGVAFAVLSYGENLSISVIRDPDLTPDSDVLLRALAAELGGLGLI